MTIYLGILLSVLFTSALSGVLGMAGGMILMAILVGLLSVSGAMMVHGAVQATSNGSRAWFLRRHIKWQLLPPYLIGSAVAVALFTWLTLVPDPAVILILIGALPWLARLTRRVEHWARAIDITRKPAAIACGFIVTAAQLLAGASGPLLDVFYLNTSLDRYAVIANKALTQTIGHGLKLVYYGALIGVAESIPAWFYLVAMATAVLGTRIGTRALDHINEDFFRRVSSGVILTLASVCLASGLWQLGG